MWGALRGPTGAEDAEGVSRPRHSGTFWRELRYSLGVMP